VAPANAAYVDVTLYRAAGSTGTVLYLDGIGLWKGAGGVWAMPGTPILHTGRRVTHPNTTDTLIEVWDDGAGAWVVDNYDSGWRDVSSLLVNGWSASTGYIQLRRIGSTVRLRCSALKGAASLTDRILTLPTGFQHPSYYGQLLKWLESQVSGTPLWTPTPTRSTPTTPDRAMMRRW
jgi:hypothetical protein